MSVNPIKADAYCSKPGAAAMATWLSNQTIGLDPDGYGKLLGEAAFTSSRVGDSPLFSSIHLSNSC